jgi:hypothetical protein
MTRRQFACATASIVAAVNRPVAAQRKLNLGIGTYTYHSLSIDRPCHSVSYPVT